eukprot:gene50701-62016_t
MFTHITAAVNFTKKPQRDTLWLFVSLSSKEFPLSDSISSAPKLNTMAVIALVAAFVVSPLGAILGHVALNQIKTSGERGRLVAIWALVLGYLGTIGYVIGIISGFVGAAAMSDVEAELDHVATPCNIRNMETAEVRPRVTATRRAAIYLRISLDQTGEGLAVERQRKECEGIA